MKFIRRSKPVPEVTYKELFRAVAISLVGLFVKWLLLRLFWKAVESKTKID